MGFLAFEFKEKENPNIKNYSREDYKLALHFGAKAYPDFKQFIKGMVLFGASARRNRPSRDVDILVIIDDVSFFVTPQVVQTYRLLMHQHVKKISSRIHITTLKFSTFWEYVRAADPVVVNILRDGVPLIDTGFFYPLQILLRQGRIRPSQESIWAYYSRAPATLFNAKWHLMQATFDLYWAAIDTTHALLMSLGQVPPSPEHAAQMLKMHVVEKGYLPKDVAKLMDELYKLSKKITHREINTIEPKIYKDLEIRVEKFVKSAKKVIDAQIPKRSTKGKK